MSWELQIKRAKESWQEIQELRDKRAKARLKAQKLMKEVRELSQEIPKKLNEYNKLMEMM